MDMDTLSPIHYFETLQKDKFPIYTDEKYKVIVLNGDDKYEIQAHALTAHTLHNWKRLLEAVDKDPVSSRFIIGERVYYSTCFSSLEKIINECIVKGQYYKIV